MKTINDYTREHSGGSSIDYNAMLEEINECDALVDNLRTRIEALRKALRFVEAITTEASVKKIAVGALESTLEKE